MSAAGAGVGIVLAAAALAQVVDAPIERYRGAAGLGEVGTLSGRAFEERRRPTGSDPPLAGTVVSLLPRSEAWLGRLESIRRGRRESVDAYRAAALEVRRSREAYEKRLEEAGAGDLAQTVTVGPDGVFKLEGVPAGPWILLASRATYVNKTPAARQPPPGSPPRPAPPPSPFQPLDRLAGYYAVTYWMREIMVTPGGAEAVELTDRNVWLSGVIEDRQRPQLPNEPYQPPR